MNKKNDSVFKPIGFSYSEKKISKNFEYPSEKISIYSTKVNDWYFNLWYIGEINENKINNSKYTFSFPETNSLLDKNLIICKTNDKVTIENDWLGAIPVYYNLKDKIISTIPDLCLNNNSFDEEGLNVFLEFGYSAFEKTPFKDVQFMRYYSSLIVANNVIKIEYKNDPVLKSGLFNSKTNPEEVMSSIKEYVNNIEDKFSGDIIIPTSGGYDSRLLNWAIEDKSRINSFTYGISGNQKNSREVVLAKEISKRLKTKWEQIELSNFNNYIEDWHRIFGFSTHLHGMYHMEFYDKIINKNELDNNSTLLSGIIGDAWAGSLKTVKISNSKEINKLGYSHGLSLDNSFYKSTPKNKIQNKFFEENKMSINDPLIQVVTMMRLKMILLSYLTTVPESFGIRTWTPFLNFDIAVQMLSLPEEMRINRKWQEEFFKAKGLDVETMNLSYSRVNLLNHTGASKYKFSPIKEEVFKGLLKSSKIKNLNKRINKSHKLLEFILNNLKLNSVLRRIGIKKKFGYLKVLSNYYVLKAIEKSIKK